MCFNFKWLVWTGRRHYYYRRGKGRQEQKQGQGISLPPRCPRATRAGGSCPRCPRGSGASVRIRCKSTSSYRMLREGGYLPLPSMSTLSFTRKINDIFDLLNARRPVEGIRLQSKSDRLKAIVTCVDLRIIFSLLCYVYYQ